ncbi:MAG: hypothetical protein Q3996_00410 [Candidatus Saccharibacteria bacterium]|nr:hypothetical protein [Candidatus Saccharibacteria bacterium]
MKKIGLIILTILVVTLITPKVAFAGGCKEVGPLGIPTWYRGLVNDKCDIIEPSTTLNGSGEDSNSNSVQAFVTKIALNITEIIARTIGIVAVGFIIFGGFKYIMAQGNASKIQGAKATLNNAIIGLIISVLATVIVDFVFNFFL